MWRNSSPSRLGLFKDTSKTSNSFARSPAARLVVEDAILLLQIILSTCPMNIFFKAGDISKF